MIKVTEVRVKIEGKKFGVGPTKNCFKQKCPPYTDNNKGEYNMYNYNYEELVTFLESKFKSVYAEDSQVEPLSRIICSHYYVSEDDIEYTDNFQVCYNHITDTIETIKIFTAEFSYEMSPVKPDSYTLENLSKLIDRFIV